VPGLTAKPIVDMLVGVETLDIAEQMRPGMESIGYDYPGDIGIPDDRIFGRDPGFRLFLVHVVEHESPRWQNYLKFRDALREDKQLSEEYGRLKLEISKKHPEGRSVYTDNGSVSGIACVFRCTDLLYTLLIIPLCYYRCFSRDISNHTYTTYHYYNYLIKLDIFPANKRLVFNFIDYAEINCSIALIFI